MVSENSSQQDDGARLDILSLKVLQLMQQIVKQKLKLQELIKEGSINLAKSRYIMGNRNVSSSQLPTEDSAPFTAFCKVEQSTINVNGVEAPTFKPVVEAPQKKQNRNKTMDEQQDCSQESRLSSDPLQWFGVLVPQNLRTAQEFFKKAINLSVEIVNLEVQLEALRLEFCTLKLEQIKIV